MLADSGATNELQPIEINAKPPVPAEPVTLHIATGTAEAWMGEDSIVCHETEDVKTSNDCFQYALISRLLG